MTLRRPPDIPTSQVLSRELKDFFDHLNLWMSDVYNKLDKQDLKNIVFTTSASAPSGGKDGDIHVRVNGASTALYININGSWSAYANP